MSSIVVRRLCVCPTCSFTDYDTEVVDNPTVMRVSQLNSENGKCPDCGDQVRIKSVLFCEESDVDLVARLTA